eukprot:TRINITY_DN10319_c0_g1_i5.p2 TRINITY_DN10319_c0_g1~~TRINITY_DN10319_c0_g1_i5.p2  ORF type:complete len:134 (+),score=14.47 TRINITY_DN10319_c0_g1_i5:87-488(+)
MLGYPMRPGEKICEFFMSHAKCKFGAGCCNHHPNLSLQILPEVFDGKTQAQQQQQLKLIQQQFEEKYYQSQNSQETLPKNGDRIGDVGAAASSSWWRREPSISHESTNQNGAQVSQQRWRNDENNKTQISQKW